MTARTSAAHVSRVLSAAGVPKSASHSTRVRGWYNTTRGFKAMQASPTLVVVEFVLSNSDNHRPSDEKAEKRQAGLERCARALADAGLDATVSKTRAPWPVLVVTKAAP